ncbi:hypothetical protein [Serratia oryzae]|uniref:hypothetical protein n=1 Tax=Serratia oryzae TaxID=2034155 RepID=UPI0012E30910|nr:hypothetical protein [Serratia oryzae]
MIKIANQPICQRAVNTRILIKIGRYRTNAVNFCLKTISLTRAGEVFLQQAITILALSEQAKQLARKAMKEQVLIWRNTTASRIPCRPPPIFW